MVGRLEGFKGYVVAILSSSVVSVVCNCIVVLFIREKHLSFFFFLQAFGVRRAGMSTAAQKLGWAMGASLDVFGFNPIL